MRFVWLVACLLPCIVARISYNDWKDPGISLPPTSASNFEYQMCVVDNDCATVQGRPYCINDTCRECDPSVRDHIARCMCPIRNYCISDPSDQNYGFCKEFESSILQRNCDAGLNKPMTLVQGINDTVFCGKVNFGQDYKATFVEWEGTCVQGTCYECRTPPIPALPLLYCNDGRSCKSGFEVYAPVGILSLNYATDTVFSLGTIIQMILIFLSYIVLFIGGVGVLYYRFQNKPVHPYIGYTAINDDTEFQ